MVGSLSRFRNVVTITLALAAALGLSGCSGLPEGLPLVGDLLCTVSVEEARDRRRAELAPVVSNEALRQADTLTVGLLATESAPLAIAASDGTCSGLSVDTALALADELGLSHVALVTVSDVDTALAQSCDVVVGVTAGEAGSSVIVGNYAQGATGVYVRGDVSAPVDASAINGSTVGVQAGSVSESALTSYELDVVESTFSNLNEAFDALSEGSVDYVVCDAYAGAYLATAYSEVSFAGTLDVPETVGVAVFSPELQSAVQTALLAVQSNGTGDVARASWVGDLPVLTEATRVANIVERGAEGAEGADGSEGAEGAEGAATDATPAE